MVFKFDRYGTISFTSWEQCAAAGDKRGDHQKAPAGHDPLGRLSPSPARHE